MCGIFGIVLSQEKLENIYNFIINGLTQLQNRGYDSCGLSILNNNNNTIQYKFIVILFVMSFISQLRKRTPEIVYYFPCCRRNNPLTYETAWN